MKIKKLMAALVVVTIMMTSVVFGATTATTTTYDVDSSTFDVQTVVTGADSATKLTYVLYNGTTPDEETILYIDQKDGSSTHTFTVNDIALDYFIGSDIIANDDVTDTAATEAVGDVYKLVKGTMTGIETITFTDEDGSVYYFNKNGYVYLPVGVTVTAEVFPVAGYALESATEGSVTGNLITLTGEYEVKETVTLNATATTATEIGKIIAVDANPIVDAEANTVTYIVSTTGLTSEEIALVGLNVTIAGKINVTMKDMRSASTEKAFGIQITDTDKLGLIGGNTYSATISYNGTELDLVNGYYEVPTVE